VFAIVAEPWLPVRIGGKEMDVVVVLGACEHQFELILSVACCDMQKA
jgi:hypothetical protein